MLDFIRDRVNDELDYHVVLEQADDGTYVATSPVLPGFVAYGDTEAEAVRKLHKAIRRNLEGFQEDYVTASRPREDRTSRHKSSLHFQLPLTMTAKIVLYSVAAATAVAVMTYELRKRD